MEVKRASPRIRLVIAKSSLGRQLQVGLVSRASEKKAAGLRVGVREYALRRAVCRAEIAESGHKSRFFRELGAEFLCSQDCLAERAVWR